MGATLILVLTVFGIILAILWALMPFAIFGTKDVLRELIRQQQRTNELLQNQVDLLQAQVDRARTIDLK